MGTDKKVRMVTKKQQRGGQKGWPTLRKWVGSGGRGGDAGIPIMAPHHVLS
jgi:hypothetical protein